MFFKFVSILSPQRLLIDNLAVKSSHKEVIKPVHALQKTVDTCHMHHLTPMRTQQIQLVEIKQNIELLKQTSRVLISGLKTFAITSFLCK